MIQKGINRLGFTLIELIIVFSVLSILSVIGVASFVNYSKTQAVKSDVDGIISVLNLARSDANSQVKPPTICSVNNVLQGYNVTFVTSGININSYTLSVVCSGNIVSTIKTYHLSKNITFNSSTNVKTIFFPVISGGIKMTNSNSTIPSGTIGITGFATTCSSRTFYKSLINIDQDGTIKTTSGC